MSTSIAFRPAQILFLACTIAGCDLDESPDQLREHDGCETSGDSSETGDGDGDPGIAPQVCGTTDSVSIYIEPSESCDAGHVHFCYLGAYGVDGIISICCDPNTAMCGWVAFGTQCADGLIHVCDRL